MTSDSDDLEEALRQNLKLRGELAAEVAKAKDSGASQRVSRGIHRLAVFLAAISLLVGGGWSLIVARECASQLHFEVRSSKEPSSEEPSSQKPLDFSKYMYLPVPLPELAEMVCFARGSTTAVGEAVRAFSYAAMFLLALGLALAITFGVSLAVYGLVRVIGWVISGFAAS
jgi:hypothetical protein